MKINLRIIVGVIIAVAVIATLSIFAFTNRAYRIGLEELQKSEMRYSATKSELISEVDNYIHKIAPDSGLDGFRVVEECENARVKIDFVLAQGEIESHFGTKGLAAKTNSVWNAGAFDSLSYNKILQIYKFKDPNNSIKPYLDLLKKEYFTEEGEEGLLNNFVSIHGKRYATDIHYEERLRYRHNLIRETTQIDSLESEMRYWAIKANRF